MITKLMSATRAWGLAGLMALLTMAGPSYATTITVINGDGAGEGFNDPSAPDLDSTAGGNTGATLGAQRLIAFQFAADIWEGLLASTVEIKVGANFNPLTCSATSAVLGSAGPNSFHRDFIGAPVAATFYVQALANARFGGDLSAALNDIAAQFNSSIGTTCLFPNVWYYGLDGSPPGSKLDFVTVVLHELAHGLGFLSGVDLASGAKLGGFDDAYMRLLENHATGELYPTMTDAERVTASTAGANLHWTGTEAITCGSILTAGRHPSGHIEMFAPSLAQQGSSVSHFSTTLSPNQLMEPSYTGPLFGPDIDTCLLVDLGWTLVPPPPTTTTLPPTTTTTTLPPTTTTTTLPPPTTTTTLPTTTTTTLPPTATTTTLPPTTTTTTLPPTTTTTTLPPPPPVTCNGVPATIVGNNNNNTIFGTAGNDVIHGRGGNDVIRGRGGNDRICGGSGADRLFGNQGRDRLFGGSGNDALRGGADNDRLFGQNGNDAMSGGAGNDSCTGGSGTDTATNCEQTLGVP